MNPYPRKSDAFVFEVEFVETISKPLEDGVIYISEKYGTSIHLCACGCGLETVIPFQPFWPTGWSYLNENGLITFSPSISNPQSCPNKAHYYMEKNKVRWVVNQGIE